MQTSTTPEALDRAWFLFQNNRFELAEQELRKYLNENPNDARAHTLLAKCLFSLSRYDEAIESAEKAIALVPDNHYPQWTLGTFHLKLRRLDEAEKYILNAIELDPEQPYCYASLSELYFCRGLVRNLSSTERIEFFQQGVEAARTGLEIEPEDIDCLLSLIVNLFNIEDDGDTLEIIKLSEEVLSLSPENAVAHEFYARALVRRDGTPKTEAQLNRIVIILEESLRLDPNRVQVKQFADYLLSQYFRTIPSGKLQNFFKMSIVAAIPLLILTFCSYNTWGMQLPTIVSIVATFISWLPIIDLTQAYLRIWLQPNYRKFLMQEQIMISFWLVFAMIFIIGASWNMLSVPITKFFMFLLQALSPLGAIVIFFMIRRRLFGQTKQ